jgi:predicted DNA-binding transcriptional regulator AlpA
MPDDEFDAIILEPERKRLTRLSRATWQRMELAGTAPRRLRLSPRRIGWRRSDLIQWIDTRRSDGWSV